MNVAVNVGGVPASGVFDGHHLWFPTGTTNSISEVDPTNGTVTATVPAGFVTSGGAFDGSDL